ncbi:MAG: GNAT family N-acetyltransferase [Clostridia bacterium]|nr:GNAT family N-acetyltransferase [Clostridia bacterium]
MPEKVAYIWEIITDQKYAKQKVATKLMEYICNKYKGYWIYSCVDMSNIPSIKLHEKSGFKPLYTFHEKQNNHTTEHVMMRKKNDII